MNSPRPADYHRLPIAEKRALAIGRSREPAVTCPACDTQVMPADLLAHMEQRCQGPREPGPGAKWIGWKEALGLGLLGYQVTRWVQRGLVRTQGPVLDRRYLLRDLVVLMARRKASTVGNCSSATDGLTPNEGP